MTITLCDLCQERAEYERQKVAVRVEQTHAVPVDRNSTSYHVKLDLCKHCYHKLKHINAISV